MILAVTPGDPQGIGPEIVWKAIRAKRFKARLLCVGARAPFDRLGARVIEVDSQGLEPPRERAPHVWLLPAPERAPRARLHLEGYQSGWSIETATSLVQNGLARALVTGPISKDRLNLGGYAYPGHTEFLADLCDVPQVTMMLANDTLRITLATTHVALKDVPRELSTRAVTRAVEHTGTHLERWWGRSRPRIGVAALNPHAGENGMFGREEIETIEPALRKLRKKHPRWRIEGPLPADTLFAKHVATRPRDRFDAVVCMYHDQGLIPVKLLDFPRTVNVTLGLPIIRTSVDHGVGFDIAGKGLADPTSLISAIRLAERLSQQASRA
jgi:4-hydroxythreonine-4-phosphate dehydrogenase